LHGTSLLNVLCCAASWLLLQAQHSCNLGRLQAACRTALSHVPLLNAASVGHHPEAPDLDLLQRQLVHGMQLLQEVQPALQQLLGPDLAAVHSSSSSSRGTAAAGPGGAALPGSKQGHEVAAAGQQGAVNTQKPRGLQHAQNSIKTTAALAEQLMSVASEECSLLGQLAQQLSQLSDLHLYANSMQVQLEQMKQAASLQGGI
jgi:hypothetical protein